MFKQIIDDYEKLEPSGTDAWNPLRIDEELDLRLRFFQSFCYALRRVPISPDEIKILDVGCGVGRSSRMLLEAGIMPGNIVAVDIRPSALEYARNINPAINYRLIESMKDWEFEDEFDICMQAVVFSSISRKKNRSDLADMMVKSIKKDGYIFWLDLKRTNDFAGSDKLVIRDYFPTADFQYKKSLYINEALTWTPGFLWKLIKSLGGTHCAALFKV